LRSGGDNSVTEVGGKNFQQWTEDLKNPDASIREEAIRALIQFGRESLRAIPRIVERLRDPDASPRVRAAVVLGLLDIPKEDAPKVGQALGARLLEDSHSVVRYYAAIALFNMGEDGRYGVDGLIRGTTDSATWETRHACVTALRLAGRDARGGPTPRVSHALIAALHDPTYRVRLDAILSITSLGKPDDDMLFLATKQALQERITDRDPTVKIWANVAMMVFEGASDRSIQTIIKYLKHNDVKVRVEAARALGSLGNKVRTKVAMIEPALVGALQDKDPSVVGAVVRALLELDPLSVSAKAAMLDQLKAPDPAVRAAAAVSFGTAGAKGRIAVPALTELVGDKEQPPYVVTSACWALGEIGEGSAATVAALNAIIQRKDVDTSVKDAGHTALDLINHIKR
jgi:HEAT repeat protein